MIDILKQVILWLVIGGLVLWIFTAFALIDSMEKDAAARRRRQRRKRG